MTLNRRTFISMTLFAVAAAASGAAAAATRRYEINLSEAEWKKRLTPAQFNTLRKEATDTPYKSPYLSEKRAGTFACAGCGLPLFSSRTKYDSMTGWPSFYQHLPKAIHTETDTLLGFERIEVECRRCGGHLGHVFDDGPAPTGKRYCINGTALKFIPGKA